MENNSISSIIYIPAHSNGHNQTFGFGYGYNAQDESFRDTCIFTKQPLRQDPVHSIGKTVVDYYWEDKKIERLKTISASNEFKLGLAMLSVGTNGSYKDVANSNERTIQATLVLKHTTFVEIINKDGLKVNMKVIDKKDATHYVRAIHHGFNVEMTFHYTSDTSELERDIKAELDAQLKFLKELGNKGEGNYDKTLKNTLSKFRITYKADDAITPKLPKSQEEIPEFIWNMHNSIAHEHKSEGPIIGYELAPLNDVADLMEREDPIYLQLKGRLNGLYYSKVEAALAKYENAQNTLNSLYANSILPIEDLVDEDDLTKFDGLQEELTNATVDFQQQTSEGLTQIKKEGEQKGEATIANALKEFDPSKLQDKIKSLARAITNKYDIYRELKKQGAILVGKNENFIDKLVQMKNSEELKTDTNKMTDSQNLAQKPKTYILFSCDKSDDANVLFFRTLILDKNERAEAHFLVDRKPYASSNITSSRISLYLHNNLIIEDYYLNLKKSNVNYLRPKVACKAIVVNHPVKARVLKMRCPYSVSHIPSCLGEDREWQCEYCNRKITIDDLENIHCQCLIYPIGSAMFSCCHKNHGNSFVPFFNSDIKTYLKATFDKKPSLIFWPSGDRYEGNIQNDQRNGPGTYFWNDGTKLTCEWKDNKKKGSGIFFWKSGERYEGSWDDDKIYGKGRFIWNDGCIEGEWNMGSFQRRESSRNEGIDLNYFIEDLIEIKHEKEVPLDSQKLNNDLTGLASNSKFNLLGFEDNKPIIKEMSGFQLLINCKVVLFVDDNPEYIYYLAQQLVQRNIWCFIFRSTSEILRFMDMNKQLFQSSQKDVHIVSDMTRFENERLDNIAGITLIQYLILLYNYSGKIMINCGDVENATKKCNAAGIPRQNIQITNNEEILEKFMFFLG